MSTYTKPHLTLREQVDLLRERGLVVRDVEAASDVLNTIGYYRLSGYWYPYRQASPSGTGRSDAFAPGTSLEQVVELYEFDRSLKLLVLDAVERVEIAVRVRVGHELGKRGPYAHLDPASFDRRFDQRRGGGASRYSAWLDRATAAQRRSTEDFVTHFREKYDDRLPTWVVTEVLDLGALSVLYAHLQRHDRDAIAAGLSVAGSSGNGDGAALANWLEVVNYVRNVCAHHSRLWNRNMTRQVATSRLGSIPALAHLRTSSTDQSSRVYAAMGVLAFLLEQLGGSAAWVMQVRELLEHQLPATGRAASEMGFPVGWAGLPLWRPGA